jgi:hypothetical protein
MANSKLTGLTEATSLATTDEIYAVVGGNSRRASVQTLLKTEASLVTITGGTIDGTVIGGTTPAAGSFTTGSFTNDVVNGGGLYSTVNNSLKIIGGGNATNAGSNLTLYGGTNASAGTFRFRNGTATNLEVAGAGDISFYEDTGNTAKMVWKAADERLGIGTSSPAYQLDTGTLGHNSTGELLLTGGNNASNDYTQTTLLRLRATSINPNRTIHDDAASVAEIRFNHADNAGNDSSGSISFYTNPNNYNTAAQERMTIDESGNVGIGTSSPEKPLHVKGASATYVRIESTSAAQNAMLDIKSTVATWSIGQNAVKTDGSLEFYNGASTPIFFTTSGAVTVGADLTLTDGNLVVAAGHGIDFSAQTGTATGTTTSELLDSYEEGTWTPVAADDVSGGNESPTTGYGSYVKVGQLVYVQFNISNIDTTGLTSGNNIYFTGLPFATKSVTGNAKYTGTAHMSLVTFSGSPMLNVSETQTALSILEVISGAGSDSVIVSELVSGSSDVHGNLCYQTA